MNQLSHGEKIKIPTPFVRSVSFDKIRSGSLSARDKTENNNEKKKNTNEGYKALLSKKLNGITSAVSSNSKALKPHKQNLNENQAITDLRTNLQQQQMKQCTFKPRINERNLKHRTIDEFVNQQLAFEKNKRDKVDEMRSMIIAKIDKQNTFRPNVHHQVENSKTSEHDVHDRLYDDWRKRNSRENTVTGESVDRSQASKKSRKKLETVSRIQWQQESNPGANSRQIRNISATRTFATENSKTLAQGNPATDRSSISRQNSSKSLREHKGVKVTKHMDVQQICDKKLGNNRRFDHDDRDTNKKNQKNQEIYMQKVFREISQVLINEKISNSQLGYIQLSCILEKMNFIDEEQNVENRRYLFEIWQMLQGDVYETVPLINLIKLIFCLLGCHQKPIIDQGLKNYFQSNQFNERVLILTQKDSKRIKQKFQEMSLNRFKKGQYNSCHQQKGYSFKPKISKNSVEMAQKYRQKVIQQSQKLINEKLIDYQVGQSGVVDHVDLLFLDEKRKQLRIKTKREELENEKKRVEDEIMGYNKQKQSRIMKGKRNTLSHIQSYNSESNPIHRTECLYQMGKTMLRQKQITPEVQLSKECTFHPNINKQRETSFRSISRDSSEDNSEFISVSDKTAHAPNQIKDYDKSIFRMYEARRIREQNFINKHQNAKQITNKTEQSPIVYLNVNMEGYQQTKVPIFRNDSMRSITHKVRILMGISSEDQLKLQEILTLQIVPALTQIGLSLNECDEMEQYLQ